ncbi:hypothetical protein [Rossellomorea marisflavi]|uniref:SCP2 domain-containing protein n=1 Tax=Rossellomorea marisflavi TaxID=189381 RepID=A0A0J5S9X4_9BACI|nr:hypothetical protein [Rossellomorea marisflavi]KMK91856.1 hypothetical protein VL03_18010 [Rossellomorea marisflavi]KML05091.1 hypothetical protein VL06_12215 [Rossellomorea marisflavi]KML35025.1 hypothetical protein VL12_02340 [Rossellomorea marisflavi]KON83898.1 hypothetical protein AF331_17250 [Rossellomorea marisflavi]KZE53226.1 hypothetical protein AV649_10665 [Rossellomorea marisflavi]
MREYLEKVVDQCETRYHLQLLFPDTPFVLHFQCGTSGHSLSISNKGCNVLPDPHPDPNLTITAGDVRRLIALLEGNERLTSLVDKKEIEVRGGYRHLLFAESVLWLTRFHMVEPVSV